MIQDCLRTSPLTKPFVEYCMALAMATRGKIALPQLTALMSNLYMGWVQSAICERANKVVKGCMRDNPNVVSPRPLLFCIRAINTPHSFQRHHIYASNKHAKSYHDEIMSIAKNIQHS